MKNSILASRFSKLLFTIFFALSLPAFCFAENGDEVSRLKEKTETQEKIIKKQQSLIDDLIRRVEQLENKSKAPTKKRKRVDLYSDELTSLSDVDKESTFPNIEFSGHIDLGYVDAQGDGTQTSAGSTYVNSRGDTLRDLDLNGSGSFLVNEIQFNLDAHITESTDVIVQVDVLPRELSITTDGGDASSDSVELDLAYLVHAMELPDNAFVNSLFGDMRLSLGKFESPIGIEYRYNNSPDRVNISRSHQSVYSVGYPVGVRIRANLFQENLAEFQNSILTYNLVFANSDPFTINTGDNDIDSNSNKVFMGRASYGLDVLNGFFEAGVSWMTGARFNQPDSNVKTDFIIYDARYEHGPAAIRFEYQDSSKDRPAPDQPLPFEIDFDGLFVEAFYEFDAPSWWPAAVPLYSLTPYYRYDTRFFQATPLEGDPRVIDVSRHTVALRYMPYEGNMIKTEYQFNNNDGGPEIDEDLFLLSYVRGF